MLHKITKKNTNNISKIKELFKYLQSSKNDNIISPVLIKYNAI